MHSRPLLWLVVLAVSLSGQDARQFLRQKMKLSEAEIRQVESGQPAAREIPSPDGSEVFLFGVVFVRSRPVEFVKRFAEVEKMVDGKGYLAAGRFSSPPKADNLRALALPNDDLEALRDCVPGDCELQLPADAMQVFRTKVPWGAQQENAQANKLLRELALGGLQAYQRGGNKALGVYRDKDHPVRVEQTFRTVLSRAKDLPNQLPAFSGYLLEYPANKPANTWDFFYWEYLKFGLKPTFRTNHAIVHQPPDSPVKWLVASKQLYATHYFQTALDMWFCVQDAGAAARQGYYLATYKGSKQDGLTGFKGGILRRIAVSRSLDAMRGALARLKVRLETGR